MSDMNNVVDSVYQVLNQNNVYPEEVWLDSDLPVVYVMIHNGDWKHEHIRTKILLEEAGYNFAGETDVDDSGDDTYSSVHRYIYSH